jgi:tRNA(Ser,Leu) C12 N-acetylase TAN1
MQWFIGTLDYLDQAQKQPLIKLEWLEALKLFIWAVSRKVQTQLYIRGSAELDVANEDILRDISKMKINKGDTVAVQVDARGRKFHPMKIVKLH